MSYLAFFKTVRRRELLSKILFPVPSGLSASVRPRGARADDADVGRDCGPRRKFAGIGNHERISELQARLQYFTGRSNGQNIHSPSLAGDIGRTEVAAERHLC